METITREVYVSLEIAKLLKKAGFDWRVRYMYRNNNPTLDICTERTYRNTPKPNKCPMYWQYAAPTLEVAQRWLREVKNVWVEVLLVNATDPHYRVDLVNASKYNNPYGIIHDADYKEYEIPEEALEAGIKRALEIILEK